MLAKREDSRFSTFKLRKKSIKTSRSALSVGLMKSINIWYLENLDRGQEGKKLNIESDFTKTGIMLVSRSYYRY
jgi:hypothetical protein